MNNRPIESWHYDTDRKAYVRGKEAIVLYSQRIEGLSAYSCEGLLVVAPFARSATDAALELCAHAVYQLLPVARIVSDSEAESFATLLGQALGKVRLTQAAPMPSVEELMRRKGWTKQ